MSIICNNLSASNVNADVNDAKSGMTKLSNMLSVLMEAYPSLQSNQPAPNQLKGLWGGDVSLQVNEDSSLNLDGVSHSSINYSLLKDDNGNQIWKLSSDSLSGTVKLSSSGAVSDFNIYVKPSNGSQFGKSHNIVGLTPSKPLNLVASAGNGLVDLSWGAPSNSGTSNVSSYKVYRNGSLLTSVNGLSHRVSGLSNGTSYSFSVSAVNSYGESPLSSSSAATPAAPALVVVNKTFSASTNKQVGISIDMTTLTVSANNFDLYFENNSGSYDIQRLIFNYTSANNKSYYLFANESYYTRAKVAALSGNTVMGFSETFTFNKY